MDYQTLKRNIIETARRDPFGFLYTKLMEKGVYYGHASAPSLDYRPTIMHVVDDGDHISLTVAVWGEGECLTCEKTTYKAHSMPNENGMLIWALDVSAYDAYSDVQDADRFLPEIIIGEALEEWEEIAASIAARGDSREYAWLFPCGLKPALNHAGMTMFASNQN